MKTDGKQTMAFPHDGVKFMSGQSGNPAGRPKGPDLGTLIRRYMNGEETLPEAIAQTIRNAVGADKKAGEAMIIAGMLQALQGNEAWAKLLWSYSDGKPADNLAVSGPNGGPQEFLVRFKRKEE